MSEKIRDILYIVIITIVVVQIGSILFFHFEFEANTQINNFFDAVWWTCVTITSVGFGDSYPVTVEGRYVGIFLMFFSIFLIGAIAGIVSHNFIGKEKKKKVLKDKNKKMN
jgi:voltage-gated potassium channel